MLRCGERYITLKKYCSAHNASRKIIFSSNDFKVTAMSISNGNEKV
jgi:hypothetical protein